MRVRQVVSFMRRLVTSAALLTTCSLLYNHFERIQPLDQIGAAQVGIAPEHLHRFVAGYRRHFLI